MVPRVLALLEAVVGAFVSAFPIPSKPDRRRIAASAPGCAASRSPAASAADRPRILGHAFPCMIDVLATMKPATVIGWHRRGYARFWAYEGLVAPVARLWRRRSSS